MKTNSNILTGAENFNLRVGNTIAFTSIVVLVLLANVLLWHSGPGVNWGLFGMCMTGLILLNRQKIHWDRTLQLLLVLLLLTALQTARFLSLANFLILHVLIGCVMGHTAYHRLKPDWTRWFQGLCSVLNVVGCFRTMANLRRIREGDEGAVKHLPMLIKIVAPTVFIVPIFAILLIAGNAVMGSLIENWIRILHQWVPTFAFFDIGWILFTLMVIYTGFFLFRPGCAIQDLQKLAKPWYVAGKHDTGTRYLQWIVILVALNLLFGFSSVTDVIYLWFSRALPEGVNHSRYVHQGVYVLVFTTILSAFVMAFITQHVSEIREKVWIKRLALLWILQNLILISGVFLRLWMYVDAFGYTPKRVYVACFLILEMVGFAFLVMALFQKKGLQWLIGRTSLAVFAYFFLLQFWNVNGFIVDRNVELYRAGRMGLPETRLLSELGTEAARYLYLIGETFQDAESFDSFAERMAVLETDALNPSKYDWRAYQWRRTRNQRFFEQLLTKQDDLRTHENTLSNGVENGSDTNTTGHP